MQSLPTIYECKTKEELYKQVLDVHKAIADFYLALPDDFFGSSAIPDGWTVRRNMKHVVSTNISFGFLIGLPSFILKLFPKPKEKQPSIEALDTTNRHGITNYGKYEKTNSANPKKKEKLLKLIESSAHKVNKYIAKRTEEELDNFGIFFSGMSVRTFVYFLLKHNVHHTNIVKLRMEDSI